MTNILKPIDFDIIFLSYDEPNAEKNYADLLTKVPWAKRVHGVEGSDAAHKACAELAETDRLIIIDADNVISSDFINQELIFQDHVDLANSVVSWSGQNIINGLIYGNGGIKSWPKHIIQNMKTHEAADPNNAQAQVDFCWDVQYCQIDKVCSTVHNNATPQQAWRAGFREGVKMTLNEGEKVDPNKFLKSIHKKNMDRLRIWQTVGLDVDNGIWAMYGARVGTFLTNCTEWDYVNVRDFEHVNRLWTDKYSKMYEEDLLYEMQILGEQLVDELDMDIPLEVYDEKQSKMFKSMYVNPPRIGHNYLKTEKSHYDIVMITYDEPEADKNYDDLVKRFPRAKRVHGIKGIHEAHIEAAKQVNSDLFWVVDGDASILDDFNFDYLTPNDERDYVKVWRSKNPINGLEYGYGGVKLLPRALTEHMDTNKPDMTTSISSKFKPMQTVSNYTNFAVDEFSAWKAAFRECVKLSSKVIDRQKNDETEERLKIWCTHAEGDLKDWVIKGANEGRIYGTSNKTNPEKLKKINDFEWLYAKFQSVSFIPSNTFDNVEYPDDQHSHIVDDNLTESEVKSQVIIPRSMNIIDTLDRFEILYQGQISNVRRMYNDHDISSIFKLSQNDDLRKAVLENNLYSLSRLLPELKDEFSLLSNNYHALWRILEKYTGSLFVEPLKKLKDNDDFNFDCFSRGQILSKKWLISTLLSLKETAASNTERQSIEDLGTVFICAGWYATLVPMLREENIKFDKIYSFDSDPKVWKIAETFNKDLEMDSWKFKATTADIHDIEYSKAEFKTLNSKENKEVTLEARPNTIINTSCEHIDNFSIWYDRLPTGKLLILQSNDLDIDEHVNKVRDLKHFEMQTPMTQVLFSDELNLEGYTRYMRIGFK